ncbi:hypothetical protein ACFX11_004247 [Malus domestica]
MDFKFSKTGNGSVWSLFHMVVNIGHQLQIISNGKLKSAEHRAVTSSSHSRTSAAFFTAHSDDCIVEPAGALISASNP